MLQVPVIFRYELSKASLRCEETALGLQIVLVCGQSCLFIGILVCLMKPTRLLGVLPGLELITLITWVSNLHNPIFLQSLAVWRIRQSALFTLWICVWLGYDGWNSLQQLYLWDLDTLPHFQACSPSLVLTLIHVILNQLQHWSQGSTNERICMAYVQHNFLGELGCKMLSQVILISRQQQGTGSTWHMLKRILLGGRVQKALTGQSAGGPGLQVILRNFWWVLFIREP